MTWTNILQDTQQRRKYGRNRTMDDYDDIIERILEDE